MTNDERLILFHQLFPHISLTVGELLNSKVLNNLNEFIIKPPQGKYIIVNLAQKQWYRYPTPIVLHTAFELTQEDADKFYQELLNMLTAQPLIINDINQNGAPINLVPFDTADWYAWSGAEKPPDSDPLINYDVKVLGFPDDLNIATVIVDATGIEVYVCSEETLNQAETWYENATPWPDNKAVIAQMSQPITPQMLRRFNFVKVS